MTFGEAHHKNGRYADGDDGRFKRLSPSGLGGLLALTKQPDCLPPGCLVVAPVNDANHNRLSAPGPNSIKYVFSLCPSRKGW